MIIWGSKGKSQVIARGQFYCPSCEERRNYDHVVVGRYFTLYFIPVFQTQKLGEYIECKACLTPFKVSVLDYERKLRTQLQKGVEAIKV
jgi:zinc-ribbon family